MSEKYYCHQCRKTFKTGREYALHVAEEHENESTLEVRTKEYLKAQDRFGRK